MAAISGSLLARDSLFGLHPDLKPLLPMWQAGLVTGKAARAAMQVSVTMAGLAKDAAPANGAKYPTGDLGLALGAGAKVIRAGVGVRAITLDYGGWDHHVDLGTLARGDFKTRSRSSPRLSQPSSPTWGRRVTKSLWSP